MHGQRHKESEAARAGRARGDQGESQARFKPNKRRAPAQPMETPIEWLNEDYAKLQKDNKALMSEQSLLYLKYKKMISAGQVEMYQAGRNPETRMIISFYNTVMDINEKLVYMLDNA